MTAPSTVCHEDQGVGETERRGYGARGHVPDDERSCPREAVVQDLCHHADVRVDVGCDDLAGIDVGDP